MKEDALRLENYGLPIGKILTRRKRREDPTGFYLRRQTPIEYNYEYAYVDATNNTHTRLERGDIVFVQECSAAPKFMHNNYAVILDRYKIVKYKYAIYQDYGAVLMVLTGENKGRVGKVFGNLGSILSEPFIERRF